MEDEGINIVHLAIKIGKKQDAKIPFKNTYNGPLTIETDWIDNGEDQSYTAVSHPQNLVVQPNGMFLINVILKDNIHYKQKKEKKTEIKKILLLKIKNS